MVDPWLSSLMAVLWVLTPAYIANALATLPRGRGPPMDFGRVWRRDGRRVLGPSKTWFGFLVGGFAAIPFGLIEAGLILAAPPPWKLVPTLAPNLFAAVFVVALLTFGAMTGDALGSFIKRRLGRESGSRAILLDQLPFVLVPIGLGFVLFPSVFLPVFISGWAVFWLLVVTLGLHTLFNWIGYKVGLKKVPW
ncbi:MAG: CDP-archaeol synthase [Thermoplasmata archaeon]